MTEKPKLIMARDFNSEELIEINNYIKTNVPYSNIREIFALTEKSLSKAEFYTIVYRFINGCNTYVEDAVTKEKLTRLLEENKETYQEMYVLLMKTKNISVNFGKHRFLQKISEIFMDIEKNTRINKLIDIFLVFAEHQTLYSVDKVTGLDMDTQEGQDTYKKLNSESDSPMPESSAVIE